MIPSKSIESLEIKRLLHLEDFRPVNLTKKELKLNAFFSSGRLISVHEIDFRRFFVQMNLYKKKNVFECFFSSPNGQIYGIERLDDKHKVLIILSAKNKESHALTTDLFYEFIKLNAISP